MIVDTMSQVTPAEPTPVTLHGGPLPYPWAERVCAYGPCGRVFAPTCGSARQAADQRFCSRRCVHASHVHERPTKVCEHCGETFTVPRWHADQRFCSHTCWHRRSTIIAREKHKTGFVAARPRPPLRICPQCRKRFRSLTRNKFCSQSCASEARKAPVKRKPCLRCAVEFTLTPGKPGQLYCSRHCARSGPTKPRLPAKHAPVPVVDLSHPAGEGFGRSRFCRRCGLLHHRLNPYCGDECESRHPAELDRVRRMYVREDADAE